MNMQYWTTRASLAIATVLLLMMSGCTDFLQDDRDICCVDCKSNITLQYRYIREKKDEFGAFVHKMNHYLFDEAGVFMTELPSNPASPQELHLPVLEKGKYQVLTIGNMGTSVALLPALKKGVTKLSDLTLSLTGDDSAPRGNVDELFWNTQAVEVAEGQCGQIYLCDMANIHCHLEIYVVWKKTPPYDGDYTFRLSNLSGEYRLDPSRDYGLEVIDGVTHRFPAYTDKKAVHEKTERLFNLSLKTEMITLRYYDDRMPILQIFHGDKAVSRPLDLTTAFREWGWRVSARPEQIYKIQATIFDDGSVVLEPWVEGTVLDWIDGGTVQVRK